MHPVLFKIGSFVIGTYGVMIVIGMLCGLGLIRRLAARRGSVPPDFFYDLLFCVMVAGFVGARATYIILNWSDFLRAPGTMLLSRQGFVFLGGLLVAVPAAAWLVRWRRLPVWEVADLAAPGLVLGHAFGRIGCFLAGCCFGEACTPATHPLLSHVAIGFPVLRDAGGQLVEMFNFAYGTQVMEGLLAPTAQRTLPMIPVQLLESFGNFMICLALVQAWRRRRFSGQIAGLYLALYSVLRFFLEFWRGDIERGLFFGSSEGTQRASTSGISTSQIICVFTLAIGLAILAWRRDKGVQDLPIQNAQAEPGAEPAKGEAKGSRRQATASGGGRRRRKGSTRDA
jgi:phosphatidylglycerol:prolipoprotein diacylglycerol transferase